MNRKIIYGLRCLFNFIKGPFLFLMSLGKIKLYPLQIMAHSVKIRAFNHGNINIDKTMVIEDNVLIEAMGGKIIIHGGFINRNSTLVAMDSIQIEAGVTIGPNVCVYDHDHNMQNENGKKPFITAPIHICQGAWIGAGAIILKGVTIGENAVVAAGAVVVNDVEAHSVVKGIPAK